MAVPYTSTPTSLTVVVNFRPTVIPSSHPNFKQLLELVKKRETTEADVAPLLDIPKAISDFTGGNIKVIGSQLFYRGAEVKSNLATIIMRYVKAGDLSAAEPFKKFLENCRQNPDLALIDTIYDWCVKGNLPITPDGELLAWKIVQSDYMSVHAGPRGRLNHAIGSIVEEPREECDADRTRTCSRGIHFASVEYIESGAFGSTNGRRIVAVVVNPADITAIPTDYNLSKGRCCKLRVVGEVTQPKETLREFYGEAKVYNGWNKTVQLPVQAGDTVRLRDGRVGVVRVNPSAKLGGIGGSTGQFYLKNGMAYGDSRRLTDDDVVETISREARNSGGFAVGEKWANRTGAVRMIASITDKDGIYTMSDTNGIRYTASGRFNDDSSSSAFDLIRRA